MEAKDARSQASGPTAGSRGLRVLGLVRVTILYISERFLVAFDRRTKSGVEGWVRFLIFTQRSVRVPGVTQVGHTISVLGSRRMAWFDH